MPITRRELFHVWITGTSNYDKNLLVAHYVFDSLGLNMNYKSKKCKKTLQVVHTLCSKLKKKCIDANRTKAVMESRHSEWLNEVQNFSTEEEQEISISSCGPSQPRGRPSKTFAES